MPYYAVNHTAQSNGDHEVHQVGCTFYPTNRKELGFHSTCDSAVKEAKQTYSRSNGCYTCSRACHTS